MVLLLRRTFLHQFRPVSLFFLPSISTGCRYRTSTTMESLSLATKYRMNSGHEIPALGYGVSIGTIE